MRLLFVGGHPKGHDEAFSVKTHSGRMLRGIVGLLQADYDFDADYFDVWENQREEDRGEIYPSEIVALRRWAGEGVHIIPLGWTVT